MADVHDIQSWLNGDKLRSQKIREQYPLIGLIVGLVFLYPLRGGSENRKKRMVFCTGVCIMAVLAYVVQNPTILARLGITGSGAGGTGSVSGVQAM